MKDRTYVIGYNPDREVVKCYKSQQDAEIRGAIRIKLIEAESATAAKEQYKERVIEELYGE